MDATPLAILGAGNLRCTPAVIGSLSTYFGERPLEIRLYDADEERLDLFDRFARLCFESTAAEHRLMATTDPIEALENASLVVLQIEENGARRLLRDRETDASELIERAAGRLLQLKEPDALLLSLMPPDVSLAGGAYYRLPWPGPLTDEERIAIPLQILRWLNKEDMLYTLFQENERSPFKRWLDDPTSAEPVIGSR